jgi:penicillin amidase
MPAVRPRRALPLLAVLLAALALLAAAPAGRAARPARVTIYRDPYGVPHVVGETREAASYGVGYALATDRLFETDVVRRLAQGRLSEIVGAGPDADGDGVGDQLEADMTMRREFFDREDIARQYRALPERIKAQLRAFASGFNAALLAQTADPLAASVVPVALAYVVEPWKPEDSLPVLMLFTMVFFAGEGASGELENAALLRDLVAERGAADGLAIWKDLLLQNDPAAPAVIDPGEGPPPQTITASEPSPAQLALALRGSVARAAAAERDAFETLRRVLERLPLPRIGSYGVAATGPRTAAGRGLLLGSPQAGFLAPAIFYELGLHWPGNDCTGFTVPGLGPFIGIGWCNGHAWTLVAGNAGDQVDTYAEELDPTNPRRYRFRGRWRTMTSRREVYLVKSTVPPSAPRIVTDEVLETVHGPVFFREGGVAYTHRRSQRGAFARTLLGADALTTGRSWREVERGLRSITATYNLLYADADGVIAYRFTGWQPVRAPGTDLRLPMPGDGSAEWVSTALAFDRMPAVVGPAAGILHVNQGIDSKPISWWPRASDVFVGRVGHLRADRTTFAAERDLDIPRMKALNRVLIWERDTVTPQLAPIIEAALAGAPAGSDLEAARRIFEAWRDAGYPRRDDDGDGRVDDPGVAIFGADYLNIPASPLWERFIQEIWTPLAGRTPRGTFIGRLGQTVAAVEDPSLFSRPYGADAAGAFRRALAGALAELRGRFRGAPMTSWRIPVPETPFTAVGVLAPPPMRVIDHGSYSQIVDLGVGRGVNILPPGNGRADRALDLARNALDSSAFPRHFTDQIALYERFEFKPMRMRPAEYRGSAESVRVLVFVAGIP